MLNRRTLFCGMLTSSVSLLACGKVSRNEQRNSGGGGQADTSPGGAGQGGVVSRGSGSESGAGQSGTGQAGTGQAGTGQAGAGGAVGQEGESQACYDGPPKTENVGLCHQGTQTCNANGTMFGACEKQVVPAAEDCAHLGDEDCDGSACSDPVWGNIYLSPSPGSSSGRAIARDASNNILWGVNFFGTFTLGSKTFTSAGGKDILLVKLDPDGNVLWAFQYGDAADQHIASIAVDSRDNVVFAGGFQGTMKIGDKSLTAPGSLTLQPFAAKLDPKGNVVFAQGYSTSPPLDGFADSVAIDEATDDPILSGAVQTAIDLGGGAIAVNGSGLFAGHIDKSSGLASGAGTWTKTFGDPGFSTDSGGSRSYMTVDSLGATVLAGNFKGAISFPGDQPSKLQTAGNSLGTYVIKLDKMGEASVAREFETPSLSGVTTDGDGSVILFGSFSGSLDFGGASLTALGAGGPAATDFFLAKLDSHLNHVKSLRIGDASAQEDASGPGHNSIRTDELNNIIVSAAFTGTVNLGGADLTAAGQDIFLAKLTPSFGHLWSKRFGTAHGSYAFPEGVAIDGKSNILLTGDTQRELDFGLGPLNPEQNYEAFLAKFQP